MATTTTPPPAALAVPAAVPDAASAGPLRVARLLPLLATLLVLTGASGLMYQVVWFRVLGLVFGVTVHATSAVLAAFMAGLAVGSLVAGRLADRLSNPLRAYGAVELLIGLTGLCSLPAFELLQPLYRWLATHLTDSLLVLTALRFGLAFAIMLVPTTLMGATLPMVVKGSLFRSDSVSHNVSLLYAGNTFGAIVGAFLAGFFLIGLYGTATTVAVAAALNLAVGASCVALSAGRGTPRPVASAVQEPDGRQAPAATGEDEAPPPALARAVLVTYALSGGIALAYEVVWTRVLAVVLPQTVYAFAIMLCAILTGIAAGSWLIDLVIKRRASWPLVFAAFEALMGITAMLSLVVLSRAYGFEALLRRLMGTDRLLHDDAWFMAVLALLTILPTALLMGATFPVAARLFAAGQPDVGSRVGAIYGANVLGGIAGSLLAGLVLIPALGTQHAIWVLAAGNVALGLVVLALTPASPARLGFGGLALALLVAAAALTPDMYQRLFSSHPRGEQVLWYQEGDDATVRVARTQGGNRVLYVNSQGQATDVGAGLNFHRALGHLPFFLHPVPRDVLVVGLGGGATAGAVSTHKQLDVTVAELHAGVVEGARLFGHVNYHVVDQPNVHLTLVDGRNHLLVTSRRYDIVQGDIIPPGNAGAANLYSADYYRLARSVLKPGGIMVQWVDASLPEYQYKLLLRTFQSVFPNATLWGLNGGIVIGTVEPLQVSRGALEAKFRAMEADGSAAMLRLDELTMASPDDVIHQFVARSDELAAYLGPGPIITDRHPSIEYTRTLPGGDRPSIEHFSRDLRPLLVP